MSDEPLLVYVSLGIGVILLIVQAVPKVLGPIGTAMQDWTRTRREARIESRQADLVDIQRQVEYLTEARKTDREQHERERESDARDLESVKSDFAEHRSRWAEREERWREEWRVHRRWDYEMEEALRGSDPPMRPSPPFMTPDPVGSLDTRRGDRDGS